jgi:hypothetical protein
MPVPSLSIHTTISALSVLQIIARGVSLHCMLELKETFEEQPHLCIVSHHLFVVHFLSFHLFLSGPAVDNIDNVRFQNIL